VKPNSFENLTFAFDVGDAKIVACLLVLADLMFLLEVSPIVYSLEKME
jgi:hypothetical protein